MRTCVSHLHNCAKVTHKRRSVVVIPVCQNMGRDCVGHSEKDKIGLTCGLIGDTPLMFL